MGRRVKLRDRGARDGGERIRFTSASVLAPLLREMEAVRYRCPGRPVIVVLSEQVGGRWWEAVLHTRLTQRLRIQTQPKSVRAKALPKPPP